MVPGALPLVGIDDPSTALLRELEAPAAGPAVEVFPDARPVLDQLLPIVAGR